MIIGITGHPASGKDTAADYLVSNGFIKVSMGDILREQMQAKNIPLDRAHIHEFSVAMRAQFGNDYLVNETVKRIHGNTVISGLRNTKEAKAFQDKLGHEFKLIAVTAPLEIRFKWAHGRGRIGDSISLEQFKVEEEQEKSEDSGSHEVDQVIIMADEIISNEGSKEDLYKKIDTIIYN